MKNTFFTIAVLCASGCAHANERPQASPLNTSMNFFTGSCWEGKFTDGQSTDVQCFRTVYGGTFVRSNHLVEGARGPYGGETIFSWNADEQVIKYTYWDTSGGVSIGQMKPTETGLKAPDETYASPDGSHIIISSRWDIISSTEWRQVVERVDGESTKVLWTITYQKAPLSFGPAPELED